MINDHHEHVEIVPFTLDLREIASKRLYELNKHEETSKELQC